MDWWALDALDAYRVKPYVGRSWETLGKLREARKLDNLSTSTACKLWWILREIHNFHDNLQLLVVNFP